MRDVDFSQTPRGRPVRLASPRRRGTILARKRTGVADARGRGEARRARVRDASGTSTRLGNVASRGSIRRRARWHSFTHSSCTRNSITQRNSSRITFNNRSINQSSWRRSVRERRRRAREGVVERESVYARDGRRDRRARCAGRGGRRDRRNPSQPTNRRKLIDASTRLDPLCVPRRRRRERANARGTSENGDDLARVARRRFLRRGRLEIDR